MPATYSQSLKTCMSSILLALAYALCLMSACMVLTLGRLQNFASGVFAALGPVFSVADF